MTGAPAVDEGSALPCVCTDWGYDERTCVCPAQERWARHLIAQTPAAPPLDEATRRRWAEEAARVEGYPPATDLLAEEDRELARTWMTSMADYCLDKGLL